MTGAGKLTCMKNAALFVPALVSDTVTEPAKLPSVVAVPEITPVMGLIVSPNGNPVALQVRGGMPPVAVNWQLYGTPMTGGGQVIGLMTGAAVTVNPQGSVPD